VLGPRGIVGTIAIVDLRLIGATMTTEPVTDVMSSSSRGHKRFRSHVPQRRSPLLVGSRRLYPSYSTRVKFLFLFLLGINALLFHTTGL